MIHLKIKYLKNVEEYEEVFNSRSKKKYNFGNARSINDTLNSKAVHESNTFLISCASFITAL